MPTVKSLSIDPAYMNAMLDSTGTAWDIVVASGTVTASNTILINSHASGGATFIADETCIDGGGNTGWIFLSTPVPVVSVPEIITNAVSGVDTTYATGSGNIIALGSNALTRRGFCFKEGEVSPTISDSLIYEDGSFGVGSYTLPIIGLIQCTEYRVRAYASDGTYTYYGNTVSLHTYPEAPTGVYAEADDSGSINISWDENILADCFNLYWSTSPNVSLSSDRIAGIYSVAYTHSKLVSGAVYYYRVTAMSAGLESDLSFEAHTLAGGENVVPEFRPANWLEIEDYIKLLTSEYQLADNFKEWLRHVIEYGDDGRVIANALNNAFDIDFASGNQLDIIGTIVGFPRRLPFGDEFSPFDPTMSDEVYKQVLKAKIALNHWDGKLLSIEEKWAEIFPDTMISVKDNQNMSMTVDISGDLSLILMSIIEHDLLIPRPEGVQIYYQWVSVVSKWIAFDYSKYNTNYGGFDGPKFNL